MNVAILAGGRGTRLTEETHFRPKALVEIGGRPILWHIMKHYEHHGFREYVIALGQGALDIKRYFADYACLSGAIRVDTNQGCVRQIEPAMPSWTIDLVDTGEDTATGGRIRRLAPYLGGETFMLTWCDGLSDVNLCDLLAFHRSHGQP